MLPCPRRCSPISDSSGNDRTGPSAHNTASTSSNTASARRVRHRYNSRRYAERSSTVPAQPVSCTLFIEAFGC